MTADSLLNRLLLRPAGPAMGTVSAGGPARAHDLLAPPARRLLVLIPDSETQAADLAHTIWALAAPRELAVLMLGVCADAAREPRARRRLATLASLARDRQVPVEARLRADGDWLQAVRREWRLSDVIVCHAEQQVAVWGLKRRPFSDWLPAQLGVPVVELAGFYPRLPPHFVNPAWHAAAAAAPFLILAAFTILQVVIHQAARGPAGPFLLSLTVFLEYGLIGLWHYFFN